MKSEMFQRAISNIDDELIEAADVKKGKMINRNVFKWASVSAAACLVIVCAFAVAPMLKGNTPPLSEINDPVIPSDNEGGTEGEDVLESIYRYAVDAGKFAAYEMGRGINSAKIGQKISDVTVTAGWYYFLDDKWDAKEHARAEIYTINGISEDTAVAIRFLDELEAEITDFYYVIINPAADKSPVQNYVIVIDDPANQDGGIENEAVPE